LHDHPATRHPDLLVGFAGSDDAGVIRIDSERALVQTVDFFTPIVDDPYDWGRIAAANALSDIYAMGADPLTALQLVGWPRDGLPMELLGSVIRGGADVMAAAGCVIVGGHSIDDREPKYGFAVTGVAPPGDITTNSSARPGQSLYLTKPIGTGILSTALKNGRLESAAVAELVAVMTTLNAAPARAVRRIGARAATDVTGFGLLGHLAEMVRASGTSAVVEVAAVPLLEGARVLAHEGMIPGGTRRNLESVSAMLDPGGSDEVDRILLADAQTSGGLLVAVDSPMNSAFEQAIEDEGASAWRIGSMVTRTFAHGPSGQIMLA
jgi:selenide, water dikinase